MSIIIDCMENLIALANSMEFNLQQISPFAIYLLLYACIRRKSHGFWKFSLNSPFSLINSIKAIEDCAKDGGA